MKLRNKNTGKVYNACRLWFKESLEGLEKTNWKTLKEFCKDWEDYEPSEPLIKDKKIRKAVRAWAEVNSIERALYAERPDRKLCLLVDMGEDDYNIDFVGWIPTLEDSRDYSIAELCGEEEDGKD